VRAAHVAETAGNHDGLVIAAYAAQPDRPPPPARTCGSSRRCWAGRIRC
jgi:hypothetical protein